VDCKCEVNIGVDVCYFHIDCKMNNLRLRKEGDNEYLNLPLWVSY